MPNASPTQSLAETILGEPLEAWLTVRSEAGSSLRTIATELRRATGDKVDVTAETIRKWLKDFAEAKASA